MAGPVYAGWVDLQSNTTFSENQLQKRYDAYIRSKYPLHIERGIKRRATGKAKGKYIPNSAEIAQEAAYETHCKNMQDDLGQARIDNTLLKGAIRYERATARLHKYSLADGVLAVDETPEIRDPDTGEVTQEYIPAIKGIEPLEQTVTVSVFGSEGEVAGTKQIPNPLIAQDNAEREAAQQVIDNATGETLSLVAERN